MYDVMVDLETMGTGADAPIIAIGAVSFNADGIQDRYYRNVDLASCMKIGMCPDPDTIMWWLGQEQSARIALMDDKMPIAAALHEFTQWLDMNNVAGMWGNGAAFDNVILSTAYRMCKIEQPWKFWNDRCYRTMKNMYPLIPFERKGTHHNALDDAESQALHLIEILKYIGE